MSDIDTQLDKILEKVFSYGVGTNSEDIIGNDTAFLNIEEHALKTGKQAIKQLMADEVKKARIDELNRISANPGEVIPYKHDSFAMGMNFYQSKIADRLAELKGDDK